MDTSGGEPRPYTPDELQAEIAAAGLTGWEAGDGALTRAYETDGWPTTLMLVNAIGFLCEAAWHHADLEASWGRVGVRLTTHSSGGVTARDVAMARRIDALALWRPAPDEPLDGTPNPFVSGGG